MKTYTKRTQVILRPEWQTQLDELKNVKFKNCSKAEMLRYLIDISLNKAKENNTDKLK